MLCTFALAEPACYHASLCYVDALTAVQEEPDMQSARYRASSLKVGIGHSTRPTSAHSLVTIERLTSPNSFSTDRQISNRNNKSTVATSLRAQNRRPPHRAISNRQFLVRLETSATHTKQTPGTSSNRHFSDPIGPNCRVEFISQS
jgi:hypothetical protein